MSIIIHIKKKLHNDMNKNLFTTTPQFLRSISDYRAQMLIIFYEFHQSISSMNKQNRTKHSICVFLSAETMTLAFPCLLEIHFMRYLRFACILLYFYWHHLTGSL